MLLVVIVVFGGVVNVVFGVLSMFGFVVVGYLVIGVVVVVVVLMSCGLVFFGIGMFVSEVVVIL